MNFKKKVLKNGLRIIAIPVKGAPSVTVMSLIEAGSEYEKKEKNGISHFLEHMFFKGTDNRPTSLDISKEFDGMGANNNAFTGNEFTGYYGKAHPKFLDNVLDIISDLYLNPTFPEIEMEKEKGVILEEINMYEDLPQRNVQEVFSELLYGDTAYGWTILGTRDNIRNMRREDLINYRKERYVSENTTVVVSGDVDVKDIFKKVERAFKQIPVGKNKKKKKIYEDQDGPQIKIKNKKTDQIHLVLGVRSFGLHDKRSPALRVLATILGGGMSSRLFQKMREELGICYYVKTGINDFSDHGNFIVYAGVDKSRLLIAIEGMLEEMRKIRDVKVDKDELKKAKDYMIGNMYLGLESSDDLANFYGFQEVIREKIKTPIEVEKEILKVTAEDIMKVAKSILNNKNLNLALIGDIENPEKLKDILKL